MNIIISFCLFVILIILYIVLISVYWKTRNIPYLIKYPISASVKLLSLQVSIGCYLEQVYKRSTDKLVGFHVLGRPGILLRDPKLINQILVKDFDKFSSKTSLPNYDNDPIGARILFKLPNPEWKIIRSQLTSAFTTGKLKHMFPKIDQVCRNMVEYMQDHDGKVMDVKEICHRFSVDTISSCIFSIEGNCFKDEKAASREIARRVFACNFLTGVQLSYHFIAPAVVKLFRMRFLDRSAICFINKMFEDIKEYRSREKVKYMDFVDTLIQILEGKKYNTPEEVVAQAAQMWIAGFETVGSTVMFALYELAKHKDAQDKLRKNITSTMKMHNDKLSYDCINNIEYLEMVVCETLRMYPIVSFADRKANSDYIIPGTDMMISKGTNIYVALLGLHYDPELFPEPHLFDAERFSSTNKRFIAPSSYLPFSEGPRNCLGLRFAKLSVKNAIVNIVANFEVEPVPYPGVKFDSRGFTLTPEEPIQLRFRRLSENLAL